MCRGIQCKEGERKLWRGGTPYNILCTETKSRNPEKYQFILDKNGSDLMIKHISMNDLNCNYTCNCGFYHYTRELPATQFLYPPDTDPIGRSINRKDNDYHITVNISKVYPKPSSCHQTIIGQNRNITRDIENVNIWKNESFYKVEVNTVVDCTEHWSKIDTIIVCVVKDTEFDVLRETIACNQVTAGSNVHILVACLFLSFGVIVAGTVALCIKRSEFKTNRSRKLRRHNNSQATHDTDEIEIKNRILEDEHT